MWGVQGRFVDLFEEGAAGAGQVLAGAVVEFLKGLADGLVELVRAEKGPVPEDREDPALDDLHPYLDLGLVPLFGPGGMTTVP